MHIPTHILSGWCIGNLLPLTPRERLFCMIAAAGADLDGVGYAVSEELYWDYHHKLGHCAAFGLLLAAIMAWFSRRRILAFVVYLSLFHVHLVLDYFGSGPGWPIYYGWPVSGREWENPRAWQFFSWQNLSAAFALLVWTTWIAVCYRRTPLERIKPSLDRKAIAWIDRRRGARTETRMKEDHEDRLPDCRAPQRDAAPAVAGSDRSP